MDTGTPVIALDHPSAFDIARVGRKAATLAVARASGLPVGSGVGCSRICNGAPHWQTSKLLMSGFPRGT